MKLLTTSVKNLEVEMCIFYLLDIIILVLNLGYVRGLSTDLFPSRDVARKDKGAFG